MVPMVTNPDAKAESNAAGDSVIGKTRAVVEALAARGTLSLAAVAHHSGVPKTTAHRILTQLCDWGIVERGQRGFILGQRLTVLAFHSVQRKRDLMFVARPYVADFFAATRVTTALFVQDSPTTVRCVEKIYGLNEPADTDNPGACAPMHCTAAGKVMLAFGTPATAPVAPRLAQYTPRTIRDPGVLGKELSQIRRTGYGIDGEEWRRGISTVAVPIIGRRNQLLGALSCGGQSAVADWTDETMHEVRRIAEAMKDQARRIAMAMEMESSRVF